jgi:CHAT domain-containing protein/Tfp pilus assembly protein PilF
MSSSRTSRRLLLLLLLLSAAWIVADDDPDTALAHARTVYSQQGPKAALPEFEEVLAQYRSAHNRRGEAITLGLIGNCHKRMGDYPKALDFLGQALQIKREINDRAEEGRTLSHLGLVYWEMAEYPQAIDHLNQSIAIARELHDVQLEGAALNNLSLVYDEQGEYGRSLEQYKIALELHRSVGYEPGQSDTLGNIGGVYLSLGRYEEAADYYQQALAISRRLQLKPSETQDLGNFALAQCAMGKIRESLATYDEAIKIAHGAGMSKEEADWLRARASALVSLGEFDEALKNFERARATYASSGLKRELIELYNDIGGAYLELGDRDSAESYFRKAVKLSDEIGHKRGSAANRLALAEALRSAGSFAQAAQLAKEAEARARAIEDMPAVVRALLCLGRIRRDQHFRSEAARLTKRAQAIAEEHRLSLLNAEAWDQLSEIQFAQKDAASSLASTESALPIASSSGDLELLWRTKFHRGEALEWLGRSDDALAMYHEAVAAIETARGGIAEQRYRTGFLRDKQEVYVSLVRLLLKMGKAADAFTYSERLREYSYRLRVHAVDQAHPDPKMVTLRARISRLEDMQEQEKARPAADQRASALRIFSDELVSAQREYEAFMESSQSAGTFATAPAADLSLLRQSVPARSAVIEFVVDHEDVIAFVLTRESLHATAIKLRESDLRSKVELLRALIRQKDADEWRKPAQSLYATLIGSLESRGWLSNERSLLLVPQGILNYLPFAALVDNAGATGKALIEKYELAELPTAMSLLSPADPGAFGRDALIAFAPERAHLQFAIPEAEEVAHSFGTRSKAVVGRSATETLFKEIASNYRVIHLATHGYFNRVNPAFSGLQFEPDAKNDGRLEVHEIAAMHLNARLVTLSACDTGIGGGEFDEIPAGDEFVGLNRAFLEAGSRAVLATLWEVNDRSTLKMMERLYSDLGEHSGIAALAESQRAMLHDPQYRHPYYWAPFTYVGKDFKLAGTVAEKR